ncbi:hypothetical protein EDD21DRAFT_448275 [Dissophora ornata]|nr:hypothetical protein EDD21DRAFT_448275 [Dissophora ornata]
MNWTGGGRTKIQANQEQVRQRQFFERQRRSFPDQSLRGSIRFSPRGESNVRKQTLSSSRLHSPRTPVPTQQGPTVEFPTLRSVGNYENARQTCIEMLRSSFDWLGEAYLLRPPPEPMPNKKRTTIDDERSTSDSDRSSKASRDDTQVFRTLFEQSAADKLEMKEDDDDEEESKKENGHENYEKESEEEIDDEGEAKEEETLQIPVTH